MSKLESLPEVLDRLDEASRLGYRLLIYLTRSCLGRGLIKDIIAHVTRTRIRPSILLVYREREDDTTVMILRELKDLDVKISEKIYDDAGELLGTTWDALIMDINYQMRPNDLGMLVEIVRGGGPIIMVGPSIRELDKWLTDFHMKCVTPPFGDKLVKRFEKRMFSKTIGRPGVIYIDPDEGVTFGENPYVIYIVADRGNSLYEFPFDFDAYTPPKLLYINEFMASNVQDLYQFVEKVREHVHGTTGDSRAA